MTTANPSLPSFVELMASLGLQDEHAANALLRGAGTGAVAVDSGTPATPYRQSTASIDSSGTPLSSASLVTPLSSPSVQRDRPTSHGKKRYSPYGLSGDPRDIYTRRGSVPDLLSQAHHYGQDRRLHHLSAPEPYHDHSSNSGRATDEDGDEEMEDASHRHHPPHTYKQPTSSSLHCAGQPNLLISRQRMRSAHGQTAMHRTKSHSHMRTTSITASRQQQQQQQQRPPMDMPMDTERSNDGDIAVVSISSLLRRSHPQSRSVAASPTPPGPVTTTGSTLSLDSPHVPSSGSTSTLSDPLRAPPHRIPPSAPPTKTSFGFLPVGGGGNGNVSATSISAVRRARHARSSSARSVRDMIRERETNVLLAPLHSFHPMGETEEEDSLKPTTESRIRHRSTGQASAHSTHSTTSDDRGGPTKPIPPPPASSSSSAHSSFLPLDDSSRSFSHRRRVKRHTAEAAATPRTGGKRSSPPPPLMLPTLPISLNIRALVGGAEREGADKDRLAVSGPSDAGYVSRREPHSPDPRGSWRRRVSPLEVAGV